MTDYAALIPINVITGFLGSGQTTLLQRLLAAPELSDTAVLVNEFGEVGLDHKLLTHVAESTLLLDNGYLTDVRTAAAGAVAAKWLARDDASSIAIIGAGLQARLQLEAALLVRDISVAHVWARDPQRAETFAEDMETRTGIDVNVHASTAAAWDGWKVNSS